MLFRKTNKPIKEVEENNSKEIELENIHLKDKVDFLNSKINRLEERILMLSASNIELQKQKAVLEKNSIQLKKLQKEKDDLFSTVIHDIKNPASAIQNFVNLMGSYDLNATDQHEIMESLIRTSGKILSLAEEVSKVVSQKGGFDEIMLKKNDINNICKSVIDRYSVLAHKKEMTIDFTSNCETEFKLDGFKIEQAIENLVSNAIKFAPNNASVNVMVFEEDHKCTVEVKDTGFGLNAKEVREAFNKGSKLSTKPTGGESSTGLGLWIVKRFVELHKGRVWVKSKRGAGSTFGFKIPMDL